MSIKLEQPISITIPATRNQDGTLREFPPIVLKEIDCSVTYDNSRKVAVASIKGVFRPVKLWEGAAYDQAGQFTDADVEARITEILGADPAATLSALLQPPARPAAQVAK